jgi:hypothetical protein
MSDPNQAVAEAFEQFAGTLHDLATTARSKGMEERGIAVFMVAATAQDVAGAARQKIKDGDG